MHKQPPLLAPALPTILLAAIVLYQVASDFL